MKLQNECIVMAMAVWLAGGIHAADSGLTAWRTSAAPTLESPGWQSVRSETLQPVDTEGFWSPFERRSGMTGKVLEPGRVQLMWSPDALYVRCRLTDSDLVASPQNRDQSAIYMAADVVELFLKCDDSPCYWEFHGSIDGKKSGWRYSSRGRLGLPGTDVRSAVTVTVQEEGTRNHLGDRDANWQILFRVDAEELRRGSGCPWPGERRWRMQLVRYNYSQYLPCREVSVFPKMREFNPHLTEDYAVIHFLGGKAEAALRPKLDAETRRELEKLAALPVEVPGSIRNPGELDQLWFEFFATGKVEPVRRLVDQLARPGKMLTPKEFKAKKEKGEITPEDRESLMNFLISLAANWSLGSNAKQHPLVRYYLEAMLTRGEIKHPRSAALVKEILRKASAPAKAGK